MKRIVSVAPRKSVIVDAAMPEINENEILIKLKYVGVCMSEHYDWSNANEGMAFGHEPLGQVIEIGKNVTEFSVGDVVSGVWGSDLPGGGGMIQFAKANVKDGSSWIFKLPKGIREVDYLLEPLACMMSAVSKVKCGMPGTTVCVVGAGYMGCGAISLLKLRGCYVIAVDPIKESRENALKYGASEAYTPDEMWQKINDGFNGYDVVMEWAETSESLDLAANLTKQCGQLCVGAYHTGEKRSVNMQLLNVRAIECLSTHPRERELSVIGASNAIKLLQDKRWNYQNVPTKVYPMSKFDQAQEELETKFATHMKAVIDMSGDEFDPYVI